MRLKVSRASADEQLIALLNEGYHLRRQLMANYEQQRAIAMPDSYERADQWANRTMETLRSIFPTPLEANYFSDRRSHLAGEYRNMDQKFGTLYWHTIPTFLEKLQEILGSDLDWYTDLPIQERLYIEDIDSFRKVRDMNPALVSHLLVNGYLKATENQVQLALEQILHVAFHRKDWGGEIDDLYTANLTVSGRRRAAAFLLKGPGIGRHEMTIADCGKNGDQLVRLFTAPADLFVVQYVGPISEMLIKDVEGKVREFRLGGRDVHYLMIDGQDTARLLHAYVKA